MNIAPSPKSENRLLAALPQAERDLILPHLEEDEFTLKKQLYEIGDRIEHVWFVTAGVGSLVKDMDDGNVIEIATVGPEGMIGLPVYLGDEHASDRAFIQVPGHGLRMPSAAFRRCVETMPTLARLLNLYTLAFVNQLAQNSACNRAHAVDQRCARWLLMTHDRVHHRTFPLTQEFLAQMLGVRRQSVSVAAGMLMKEGLIQYSRGGITILDRSGLEQAACGCYRAIAERYEALVGARG